MYRSRCSPCSSRRYSQVESSWGNVTVSPEWPRVTVGDGISPREMNWGSKSECGRLTTTNSHSWKIFVNSVHIESFKCFAFDWVIWPEEKSNTSSLREGTIRLLVHPGTITWEASEFRDCFDTSIRWFYSPRRYHWWNSAISSAIRVSESRQATSSEEAGTTILFTWTRMMSNLFK